ncbi:T9SS type B sorting domain-containing protein [Flavobacterium granuli]|uniref:Gliding motility-associated C-terminal domain-containing protein n=1 Tax=Flavobacterium granuli TaxID=280093 RepID=A0A1M5KA07_9FLAO|nr:T9SS type B sorting domain-containing protein [Flavobacterium granuli]PRZ26214.1 gliding motility-associated-like protein [Flavobacterium granuli]SHG49541.1 gliding motility-associated C-terminal domain-containing protein [Flavobacterium granuli]
MHKTTFLKVSLLTLIFLQGFISYSQNLVSYVSKSQKNSDRDIFRIEKNISATEKQVLSNEGTKAVDFIVVDKNPVIKYAELPYSGQVSICPNNGKELPKLFLCGGNDSRLIETGITDAQSIIWERFISGGSCITVSNSDCANESAALSCWAQVATGKDYLANSAGQFRVKIVDKTGTPYVYYFNVYQNTLVPTAVAKSDIVKYGTGTCQIDGKITVGGFGPGYEYSFTTSSTPGTWQDSNVFTTGTAGNYTAFIRIKDVVGSCEFKVINLEIKSVNFGVTTTVVSPKCYGDKGSIKVNVTGVKQYKIEIFNSANNKVGGPVFPDGVDHTFKELDSGTYKVVTSVEGNACMVDTQTVTITSPTQLKASATITNDLSACSDIGEITVTATGGTTPYKYLVNVNNTGFVSNGISNKIKTVSSGTYVVRVEDANGCFIDNTVTVPIVDKPSYTINRVDSKCKDDKGQISLNITEPKLYTIEYSIDNGKNFKGGDYVFSNLVPDNYIVIVRFKRSDINSGKFCSDPSILVQIGGSKALTASAGVAELAGCRSGGAGRARITNVEGGTAPYQYSFDGGGSWGTLPEKDLMPGTYIPSVKDANGCVFVMEAITIDKIPQKPVITVDPPVFNCDGTATTSVTVTNSVGTQFSYDYYLDGVLNLNSPSNVFKNVSQGDHTITVSYNVLSVSTYSNLLKEDFGSGASTTTPGIATAYCFNDQRVVGPYNCGTRSVEDNQYSVTSDFWRSDDPNGTNAGAWFHYKDHTTSPGNKAGLPLDPKGRFLLVNIGSAAGPYGVLYSKPINDVIPNQPVIIDVYLGNLLRKTVNAANPDFIIELVDESGRVVASQATGIIPNNESWNLKTLSLNPGDNTNLTFKIRSGSILYSGNDAVIDDILVYQLPKSCNTTADFPIVVDGSKAFSAGITGYKDIQCNGQQNGEITLSAKNFDPVKGFQYSVDGGLNWQTEIPSPAVTSGSVTLTGLASGIYNISIRYDNSAKSCTFPLKQEIKMPKALIIDAKVTTDATCVFGATITAKATEGTPGYQYQLLNADGTILRPFQVEEEFTDVPVGSYTVVAKDINLCQTAVPAAVDVVAAIPPTAVFEPSNLCFDSSAEIKVKVTGGVGPYTYTTTFNGGQAIGPSATFDGPVLTYNATASGTYEFEITDSYGCKAAVISQDISAKLTAKIDSTTELDCDVAPNNEAVITGTITGGTAPFVVTVFSGTGPGIIAYPSATTFTYTTAVASTYEFEVKDFKGCITTVKATINPITNPIVTAKPTAPKCIGHANGEVELVGSGGSPGYYYKFAESTVFAGSAFSGTTIYKGLKAGIEYSYQVKDSKGCLSGIEKIMLTDPTPVTATISATDLACSSTGTKAAIVTIKDAAGGAGGYTYSFNGNTNYTTANTFSTTKAGTINAYIKDKNGCEVRLPDVVIAALSGPTGINVFFETGLECPDYTAHVKFQTIGGQSPIRYQVINVASGASIQLEASGQYNLPPGDYTFTATDRNGCSFTLDYNVKSVPDITAGGSVLTPIKCFGDKGDIQFTVGGLNSHKYDYVVTNTLGFTIDNKTNQSAATISLSNLVASSYTIVVKDRTTGCTATYTVALSQPNALTIISAVPTKINCKKDESEITVTVSGGTTNYSYAVLKSGDLSTPVYVANKSVLTVDTNGGIDKYWVVYVKDVNGCTTTKTVEILSDEMPTLDPITQPCYMGTPVDITLSGTVSVGTASYGMDGVYQNTKIFKNISPGTYIFSIKDGNGCEDFETITIDEQLTLTPRFDKNITCTTSAEAQVTLIVGGGRPVYKYEYKESLDAGYTLMPSNIFKTLTAGKFTFRVTDGNGCIAVTTKTIDITLATPPEIDDTAITTDEVGLKQTKLINCSGEATAAISITLDPAKGQAPFVFKVERTAPTYKDYGSQTSGLTAGTYTVTVTDAKGCTDSEDIIITEPKPMTINHTEIPITCVEGVAGVPSTSKGSIIIDSITDGTAGAVGGSGGTAPYNYYVTGVNGYKEEELNNAGTTSVKFNVVDFGLYQINVVDANGCSVLVQDVLVASDVRDLDISINSTADCIALGSAEVKIGTTLTTNGPFHFAIYTGPPMVYNTANPAWKNETVLGVPPGVNPGSKKADFTGLTPGVKYTFVVYDESTGCYYYETAETAIPTNSKLELSAPVAQNITCADLAAGDGKVSLIISSDYAGPVDVTYQIFNSQSLVQVGLPSLPVTVPGFVSAGPPVVKGELELKDIGTLPFGNYYVLVKETTGPNAGCSVASMAFNITKSARPLSVTAAVSKNENCNELGIITAEAMDGTGPYKYQITVSATMPAVDDVNWADENTFKKNAGSYYVWAKDKYNCIKSFPISLIKDAEPVIDPQTAPCFEGASIDVTITGSVSIGTAMYSIDGVTYVSDPKFTIYGPGSYTLYIQDGNGCIKTTPYEVNKQLILKAKRDNDLTCFAVDGDAKITLTASEGTSPYVTYEYSTNDGGIYTSMTPNVLTTAIAGTYIFRVTDTKGCQAISNEIVVTAKTKPDFTADATLVSCFGDSDGTITITPKDGLLPYEYSIDGAAFVPIAKITGLAVGTYKIIVRDSKECLSDEQTIEIKGPVALAATPVVKLFGCSATNTPEDAVVTINVTAGTGTAPYTYSFNGGPFGDDNTFAVGTSQKVDYVVLDGNGCNITGDVMVNPYNPPTAMTLDITPIYCNTVSAESKVIVTDVAGGSGDYSYEILYLDPDPTVLVPGSGVGLNEFTGLVPGVTYKIKVTDKVLGCSIEKSVTIKTENEISVTAQLLGDVFCKGDSTGSVAFTVSNYITATKYTYNLATTASVPSQSGDVITYTGLAAGKYTFTVTDDVSGCIAEVIDFIIAEPADPLDFTTTATNINCDKKLATITVTATGGTENYGYAVVKDGDPAPTVFGSNKVLEVDTNSGVDMDWVVYVQDANGCPKNSPVTIVMDASPVIDAAVAVSQCPSPTATYDIKITATGVGSLEYSIGSGFTTNSTITVGAPGTYDVTVRDKNGCINPVPFQVTILNPLQLSYDLTASPICNGTEGEITLKASGGSGVPTNYEYSKNGGGYVSSPVFAGLAPGTYIFSVRDKGTPDLCTKEIEVIINAANKDIDFTLSKTDVICNGDSNGSITVKLTAPTAFINNNPVYSYVLTDFATGTPIGGSQTTPVFSGLAVGKYVVTATSGRGCEVAKDVTIDGPLAITVQPPVVDEYGCAPGTNGTNYATITVGLPAGGSNDFKIYEFLRDGNPIPVQRGDNPVYTETDLLGGRYVINVYDTNGCVGTTTATINPFVAIDFASPSAITVTKAITCVNNEDIQVNVTLTGGAAVPLEYTIVATVDDATLGTVGNAIPYATQTNNSGEFKDLTVGSYAITVTNTITKCSIKTIHYVNEPNTFDLVASNVKNVICYGTATGSVDLTFVDNQLDNGDAAGAFEYTITGPAGTDPVRTTVGAQITIPNLVAGIYTVKAKLIATPSCEVETRFTIAQPNTDLSISVNSTPITCDPGNDGTITVSADGGWSAYYKYELVGVGPAAISVAYSDQFYFENLTPGTYTVNVKDMGGCVETQTVTLKDPDPIIVTANARANMLDCNGGTIGEIVVDLPTGGQGSNYSYILNYVSADPVFSSAPQANPIFSGLAAGIYTVTVVDGLNCVSQPTADIIIDEPTKVEATLVLASGITCKDAATLTLSASGGTGKYEYSTDKNFTTPLGTFTVSETFSVGLGDHQYYVRDEKGCVSFISNNVTINEITPLSLVLDLTNAVVYCKGDASATIDASATGGLGNYSYTLLDSAKNPIRPSQANGYFDKLSAGDYIVRVDSDDCQYDTEVISVSEPPTPLTIDRITKTDVTCNGENNGKIEINASGGTGQIKYAISPRLDQFFDSGVFDELVTGVYQVVIQDENGCFIVQDFEIKEPSLLSVSTVADSVFPEICAGDKDGAFSIEITGGTAPYSVSLGDINGTYTTGTASQTEFDFTGLGGGNHFVFIRDANGCTTDWLVALPESINMNPIAIVDYGCVNNAAANSVTITIDDSITNPADVDYALDGGNFQASSVFTNLTPGFHFVTARHSNGCEQQTINFEIKQVEPLTLVLNDGGLNEIVAVAAGGGGNYKYTLNGESYGNKSNFIIYKSGNYTVTVTDGNGCVASATRYFEYIDVCIPNNFTPNGDGINDVWAPGCTVNYKDLTFEVFDRYGRKVGNYRLGQYWDGRYNGTELPSGDYWYVLKLNDVKDAREFVGHFTLYR